MICEIYIILHISKLKCPIKFRQSVRIFQSEFLNFSNEAGLLCLFFQHQILSKICPSWWNVLGISSICVWNMLRCSFSNFPPKKRAYVLKRAHALKTIQKTSENHEHRRPEKQVTTTHLLNCKKNTQLLLYRHGGLKPIWITCVCMMVLPDLQSLERLFQKVSPVVARATVEGQNHIPKILRSYSIRQKRQKSPASDRWNFVRYCRNGQRHYTRKNVRFGLHKQHENTAAKQLRWLPYAERTNRSLNTPSIQSNLMIAPPEKLCHAEQAAPLRGILWLR